MKSIRNETKATTYPALKELLGDGEKKFVVLFTAPKRGHVVHTGTSRWSLGYTADDWRERDFTLFDGHIVLSN